MYGSESVQLVPQEYREPELLEVEKRLCEYFVQYYIECQSTYYSALKVGYSAQYADYHGRRLFNLGYTQRLLAEYERSPLTEEQIANLPGVVIKRALKESVIAQKGASRVTALKLIANTQGMERGTTGNTGVEDRAANNVMIAPMADNPNDWAVIAEVSQEELRQTVRD